MKLLSKVDTLSVLFLKSSNTDAASQLLKKYASNKSVQKSPQFREILFDSIYNQILDDIVKLNTKQQQMYKLKTTLIEKSLQSLQLDKLTENMMAFDKDNELMQCIYLCDAAMVSNIDLELSAQIIDYARRKLNSLVKKKRNSIQRESSDDSEDDCHDNNKENSSGSQSLSRKSSVNSVCQKSEEAKFDVELQGKLGIFIEAAEMICNNFDSDSTNSSLTLVEFLNRFDGICVGLNGKLNRNALYQSAHESIDRYKNMVRIAEDLSWSKQIFENQLESECIDGVEGSNTSSGSGNIPDHENYFRIVNLLNEFINLDENEDFISKC